MAIYLVIIGSVLSAIGVFLNMKYSIKNDLEITADGGNLDAPVKDDYKIKAKRKDRLNMLGSILVIIGIILNVIAVFLNC